MPDRVPRKPLPAGTSAVRATYHLFQFPHRRTHPSGRGFGRVPAGFGRILAKDVLATAMGRGRASL